MFLQEGIEAPWAKESSYRSRRWLVYKNDRKRLIQPSAPADIAMGLLPSLSRARAYLVCH